MSVKTYAMAIRDTLAAEMRRDERVFCMGEDIETAGGSFGCTRDLYKEFGIERVRNTPISEAGFVGMGVGAANAGMRPVVELMYWDFSYVCMDQILNQAAKIRYMFGGKARVPLVIRGQQGIGKGNAAQHSQCPEVFFMHMPGLKVAMPSCAEDACGLLRTAIRDDNPVAFIEHKALYFIKQEVPEDPDFMIPFGQAKIKREGSDVTVVGTHLFVGRSLEAADIVEKEGISCEVIDPRTIVPFDYDTVIESVKKTGRLVIAHEAYKTAGMGAQVAAYVQEHAFKYLDAPIQIVGAMHCPIPFNATLENTVIPSVDDVAAAIRRTMYK